MSPLGALLLGEIPFAEGARVALSGLAGVFVALALLAVGIRGVALVISRLEELEKRKAEHAGVAKE